MSAILPPAPAHRIDAKVEGRRGTRVVALDDGAATLVRRLARRSWNAARFTTLPAGRAPVSAEPDMALHLTNGHPTRLADELNGADLVVMVATGNAPRPVAAAVGAAAARRGIATVAVVLGEQEQVTDTLLALRPYSRVLVITTDPGDVAELLTSLRS